MIIETSVKNQPRQYQLHVHRVQCLMLAHCVLSRNLVLSKLDITRQLA
jgi:hypothetical protein